MKWNKRRQLCLLLALMTALPGAFAEEAAPADATVAPTVNATAKATPTVEATTAPVAEATNRATPAAESATAAPALNASAKATPAAGATSAAPAAVAADGATPAAESATSAPALNASAKATPVAENETPAPSANATAEATYAAETPAATAEIPASTEAAPAGDENTPAPATDAPPTPTPATDAPTRQPDETPLPASTPEISAEPSTEPSVEPSVEPSMEPGTEPSVAPSMEPGAEPSVKPSAEPSLEPSVEPSVEPSPEPDETPLLGEILTLVAEGATQDGEGVWQFSPAPDAAQICFSWNAVEGATIYACEIFDEQGNSIDSTETEQCRIERAAKDFTAARYTLRVRAVAEEAVLAEGSLRFCIAQSGFPNGGRPSGGFGGGRPSIGGSGGAPEGMSEAEQGFRVTPGEALTSSHASGTKDMQLYGTVALEPAEGAVTQLTLGGAELSVTLDGGASAFTATLGGDALTLTPESEGARWTVNARALETLNRSGAATLALALDGETILLPTDLAFRGATYAALRARGFVSGDFNLQIDRDGLRVEIDGQIYLINESGELIAP